VAANAIAVTVSGGHLEGVGAADGAFPNSTGLEARFMGEVGHAVARQRLDIETANALILALLEKYEHVFSLPGGNPGARFDQAYDRSKLEPLPVWQTMYEKTKHEINEFGLLHLE
ncbi:MAG: monomethylamine:corrinoid methyltransferase, partial [Anaerolineaceae bacterium]